MRALIITLWTSKPVTLPLGYNHLVQGMLYDCWRESDADLHDQGFDGEGQTYRFFAFGQLEGKAKVDSQRKTITFPGIFELEVRSPVEDLLDDLAQELAGRGKVRLGGKWLQVVNLTAKDRLLFPCRAYIRTKSPVTCHRTLPDGFTEYFAPTSPEFAWAVQSNAARKAEAFGLDASQVTVMPLAETMRKRVVQFKGTYVNAWEGRFVLGAEPRTMQFLYSAGLGDRNSQGFGLFEIEDRPL